MPYPIGQVLITATAVVPNATAQGLKRQVEAALRAGSWEFLSVSGSIAPTFGIVTIKVVTKMYQSLEPFTIGRWFTADMAAAGITISGVSVIVTDRYPQDNPSGGGGGSTPKTATPKTTTPKVTTVTTATQSTNNTQFAEVNSRLDTLIANLNKSNGNTSTTKKSLDTYAAEFGVSKTALTLLVAAVGITVLFSLTKK